MKSLVCLLTIALAMRADEAFWKAKEKAYERIKNGEILVSVLARETPGAANRFVLRSSGGGRVEAPRDFVFGVAQDFARSARASEYVKAVSYDRDRRQVTLDLEAYGRKARFVVEVQPRQGSEPWQLAFTIKEGPMAGMAGALTFASLGQLSEVGFNGDYKYDSFPVPKIFLEFGFEVVLQRMAMRLRAFAEGEWRKHRKVDSR